MSRRLMVRVRVAALAAAGLFAATSCNENLPNGPTTFSGKLAILVSHDTAVVGDASNLTAQATDGAGHTVQGLSFTWTSADTSVLGFASAATTPPATGDSAGNVKTFVAKHPGLSTVTLTLPDPRFVVTTVSRTETVVVGGVGIFSSRDSTLTAVNDTGVAIGMGLVHAAGSLVKRANQGVRWTHLGGHVTTVGAGDTLRYVARSNGADTLIVSHDFCLIGAKCADTAIVRVAQQLTLTLSAHNFLAWSFADTTGPSAILADRRGNGLLGTSIAFVPVTPADAAVVKVTPVVGIGNAITGQMAVPRLVSTGNGTARVNVIGLGTDGTTVVATDVITETVRQVARRVAVEPLRAVITANDSIPIRPVARDARGVPIGDAALTITPAGIAVNDVWAGPMPIVGASATATITANLTGVALPVNNPGAPQLPVISDQSVITILQLDSAKAGSTARPISLTVLDSIGLPAINRWIRFGAQFGPFPDSAQADVTGTVSTTWHPRDTTGFYTLTGVRGALFPLNTLGDSLGRVVVRHSILVSPDVPSSLKSTVATSATNIPTSGTATITVTIRDQFGNLTPDAVPTDITLSTTGGGTLGPVACLLGVCTATYTAPAVAGPATISVKILGLDILFSPLALTIF